MGPKGPMRALGPHERPVGPYVDPLRGALLGPGPTWALHDGLGLCYATDTNPW